MRKAMVGLLLLAACATEPDSGRRPGVFDQLFLYNPVYAFTEGQPYELAAYWQALDGAGQEMAVDSVTLLYSLGDTGVGHPGIVTGGSFPLRSRFRGFVYLYSFESPRRQLGRHYIGVLDSAFTF